MTGASLTLTTQVDDREVRRAFGRLQAVMNNTTPIMAAIGTGIVGSTHQRFITQTAPDGSPWAALNPEYAAGKRRPGILTESGRLGDTIHSVPSRNAVAIGTNVIYAAIHQFGGTIKPKNASHLIFKINGRTVGAKSVTIPARPYLGISADDEVRIAEVIFGFIKRRLKR